MIVLAAVAGFYVVLFAGFYVVNHFYIKWEESHDIAFDIDLWNAGSRDKIYSAYATSIDAPRIKMCADFIANQPWKSKTRSELEEWLGKPDNFAFGRGWEFNYWVGLQRGPMKMDSAWLAFRFDADGRAVEAKMLQD